MVGALDSVGDRNLKINLICSKTKPEVRVTLTCNYKCAQVHSTSSYRESVDNSFNLKLVAAPAKRQIKQVSCSFLLLQKLLPMSSFLLLLIH